MNTILFEVHPDPGKFNSFSLSIISRRCFSIIFVRYFFEYIREIIKLELRRLKSSFSTTILSFSFKTYSATTKKFILYFRYSVNLLCKNNFMSSTSLRIEYIEKQSTKCFRKICIVPSNASLKRTNLIPSL